MPTGPGLAVLRFSNPSGDSDLGFLDGGITEEITTQLTRYSELRVAARALTSELRPQRDGRSTRSAASSASNSWCKARCAIRAIACD